MKIARIQEGSGFEMGEPRARDALVKHGTALMQALPAGCEMVVIVYDGHNFIHCSTLDHPDMGAFLQAYLESLNAKVGS